MCVRFIICCMIALWASKLWADTCSPGYYVENNDCIICPKDYACPDGKYKHFCTTLSPAQYTEDVGATECINCPTEINYHDGFSHIYHYRGEGGGLKGCRAYWEHDTEHGRLRFSCQYSEEGYDIGRLTSKCMMEAVSCNAGYATAYKPNKWGQYFSWDNSFAAANGSEPCTPAGIGNYSPDLEVVATKCPDGTSTHTDIATSIDDCKPLCTGGATQLHAGKYTFSLWKDKSTTPSLNIRMPGGDICYINTAIGLGTVNFQYNNIIYHMTN